MARTAVPRGFVARADISERKRAEEEAVRHQEWSWASAPPGAMGSSRPGWRTSLTSP